MTQLAGIVLYDVQEVAGFLDKDVRTINKMCREKRIKGKKVR